MMEFTLSNVVLMSALARLIESAPLSTLAVDADEILGNVGIVFSFFFIY